MLPMNERTVSTDGTGNLFNTCCRRAFSSYDRLIDCSFMSALFLTPIKFPLLIYNSRKLTLIK